MSSFKDWFGRTFHGKKLAFLGLKDSGKSQFLKSMGCRDAMPGTRSNRERYRWFKVVLPGKSIYVKAGCDYGGGKDIFTHIFNSALQNSDFVYFVVDIQKFIQGGVDSESQSPYKDQVLERLEYINGHVPSIYIEKFSILLTHADLMAGFDENRLVDEFQRVTREKPYSVLTRHCFPVDARDPRQVLSVFKRSIGGL